MCVFGVVVVVLSFFGSKSVCLCCFVIPYVCDQIESAVFKDAINAESVT